MIKKNKEKVALLHLITGLNAGGAEKVVFDLSRKSTKNIFSTQVVSISGKHTDLIKKFNINGINTTTLEIDKSISSIVKGIKKLIHIIKINNIQIIHAHMTHSMILAGFIRLFHPSIKIVFTSHSINVGSKFRELMLYLFKRFRHLDIIFSEKMKSRYYKKKLHIIPNGIETSAYDLTCAKFDKFSFLTIGRIEYVKNHILLLNAASKLNDKFDFEILIVGNGILKEELTSEIEKLNMGHRVKLLGFRDDIAALCNKAHVFLMPSHWEGLPISMLEAGASGLPVISTPVGSIPSLINKNTGYLSSQEQFAETMLSVYQNYETAQEKGKQLKSLIQEKYDLNQIVLAHENIYKSLV